MRSCSPGTRTTGAAPPEGGHPHGPHHPRGAHPGRRVRDRQPERGRDSVRRDPALGDGPSGRSCSAGPAIRDLYIAMNTTRGPLRDVRVRRALNLAIDVETLLRTRDGRAAACAPPARFRPASLGYDSTRAPYPWDTAGRTAAARRGGLRQGLQAPALAQQARGARPDRAVGAAGPGRRRHPGGDRGARRAERARRRSGTASADLYLGDWYADYPDPENFSYPALPLEQQGARRQLRLPGRHGARRDDHPRARTTPDTLEKARLAREIDARVFDLAPWIFLWFPGRRLGRAARREGLADPGRSSPASGGLQAERIQ